MDAEVAALTAAALVQIVQVGIAGYYANSSLGVDYMMGPRDEQRPRPGRTGRASRAVSNHVDNLLLFAVAVVVVILSDEDTWWTGFLAWVYVLARVAYVPAYIQGWVPWRSVLWGIGLVATLLMLLAAIF
jgi:uncharacterized MAPEG superfamily protein